MKQLQIKNESLPQRCEICHQTDTFDAAANRCARCADIAGSEIVKSTMKLNRPVRAPQFLLNQHEESELVFFARRILPGLLLTIFARLNRAWNRWISGLDLDRRRRDLDMDVAPVSLNLSVAARDLALDEDDGSIITLDLTRK